MAEVNLGKIKPLWRGNYTGGVLYRPLDFLKSGGVVYICTVEVQDVAPPNLSYYEAVVDDQLSSTVIYAIGQLAGGESSKVGVISIGVVVDTLDWLVYPSDGRIYKNNSVTGTISGDFNPSTGVDTGLSGALIVNPAVTDERATEMEGSIAQNTSDIAQNTSDIAQNTSDIAQNTSDIAQNTSDIADNTSAIDEINEKYMIVASNYTTVGDEGNFTVTTDTNLPDNITIDTRYILTNPFGLLTPVIVEHQLLIDGVWTTTGQSVSGGTSEAYSGVLSGYVPSVGVVIQTADTNLVAIDSSTRGMTLSGGTSSGSYGTLPCRLLVKRF